MPSGSVRAPLVEFVEVTKDFPGQRAVDAVTFSIMPGEIHALVGENGAGKSTLIKVLSGNLRPTTGVVRIAGEECQFRHPGDAADAGIGVIHQDPALFPSLSVAENLAIGRGFERRVRGFIAWSAQYKAVRPALERVGLHVDPRTLLRELTTHQRQLVALAKVLLERSRVVVLDEVTAPLTQVEVGRLFAIVRQMRRDGVAVVYVSHRLQEVFDLADTVTVMRNGRHVATKRADELSYDSLARLIIGSDPSAGHKPAAAENSEPVLTVTGLCDDLLRDVSFTLGRGEVLGLAGLAGAGRTNVLECIYGMRRRSAGAISIVGDRFKAHTPADAVRAGIAMVTEERHRDGYVPTFSVRENITLPWLGQFARHGFLNLRQERDSAARAAEAFDVRAASLEVPMANLSGGNQQKAILARWLSHPIKVLLLDEPTHGVDIGARGKIYDIIQRIAATGVGVVVVSSDLDELEVLCSRVLLLAEGRIAGQLRGTEIQKENMLAKLYAAMSEVSRVR